MLSIAGSEDGLSTPDKIADARDLLPQTPRLVEIDGASHSTFGDYGLAARRRDAHHLGRSDMIQQIAERAAAPFFN